MYLVKQRSSSEIKKQQSPLVKFKNGTIAI